MTDFDKRARTALNNYLSAELGRSIQEPDEAEIRRQQRNFLMQFGPEQLAAMSRTELLVQIPLNAEIEQPMDYWLEFKNDDQFDQGVFGNIPAMSQARLGTWQEKETRAWRAKLPGKRKVHNISEDEALRILKTRRSEMLAAVKAVEAFDGSVLEEIQPSAFQAAIETAAPTYSGMAWFHKYLHLNFPNLITWTATASWSEAEQYRVGVQAKQQGIYARDIEIIRYWNSLEALQEVSAEMCYRMSKRQSPREHWILGLAGLVSAWQGMLKDGYLTLGPDDVGNLAEVITLTKKRDIQDGIKTAFLEANLETDVVNRVNLTELAYRLKEGSLVALFSDQATVIAVGEVTGGYRYMDKRRPHRVPVSWLHQIHFDASRLLEIEDKLMMLEPGDALVAEMEASLLLNGVGAWTNVSSRPQSDTTAESASPAVRGEKEAQEALPALEGIARHVVAMLVRKRQVILYGPPGTGKTWHAERIALELVARHNYHCQPSHLTDSRRDEIYGRGGTDPFITTCTFHPMYAYEDFIEGYRPSGDGFEREPGIFKRMATAAQVQPDKRFVLIIDEINRGNIPKIFGELITLLEMSKRGTTSAMLPLSKELFSVPRNLYIIGTMNTADRSILLLDTALRRRFAFKELLPETHLLQTSSIGNITLSSWLRALNRRIVEQLGRDGRNLQVGHAYLMPGGKVAATLTRIGEIVRDELWPLLQEYCYEDYNKLANILAADKHGIYCRKKENLRFELFEPGRENELIRALTAIVTPEDKKQDATLGEDVSEEDDSDARLVATGDP